MPNISGDRISSISLWDHILYEKFEYERIKIKTKSSGKRLSSEISGKTETLHYEIKSKPVIYESQECRLIIVKDITELLRGEYAKEIEKLSQIMIASTSHDMRTPLNTTISMLSLIEQKLQDDLLSLRWIKVANCSTSLLKFLVNDTLDYV